MYGCICACCIPWIRQWGFRHVQWTSGFISDFHETPWYSVGASRHHVNGNKHWYSTTGHHMLWMFSAYQNVACKWVAVIPLPSEPSNAEPKNTVGLTREPIHIGDQQTHIPLIAGISTSCVAILLIIAIVLGCLHRNKLLTCCQSYYQQGRNPTWFLILTHLCLDNLEMMWAVLCVCVGCAGT